ncbi:hypothetical protein [Streptomyces tricolor]|uniref:hypothetical protein n=1 Tax=Streptomyces tricolor TaxID=68277 RepID=UPI003D7159A8
MLSLTGRALAAPDAVTAEARRLTRAGEQKIRMGASTLIGTVPRDLVLREAVMRTRATRCAPADPTSS